MKTRLVLIAPLLMLLAGVPAFSGQVVIESFGSTGVLRFNEVADAEYYRIEWAPSVHGPWTNFTGDAGAYLDHIPATGSGIVTASVPMLYRVVARMEATAGMALIPGGTNSGTNPLGFAWGADEFYHGGWYPATYHLEVDSFYMDKYPVTKALWDDVYTWAIANEYSFEDVWDGSPPGRGKAPNHPVHTVSWYDAVKWCNARSERWGREPVYYLDAAHTEIFRSGSGGTAGSYWEIYVKDTANGYRLPTMSEWEYAARGGLESKRFPWGDRIDHDKANYVADNSSFDYDDGPDGGVYHPEGAGYPHSTPVGYFPANNYGLHDVSGNVWEWCFDWKPGYVGESRVRRGGAWNNEAIFCRVGYRGTTSPVLLYADLGFRTVLPPDQQ